MKYERRIRDDDWQIYGSRFDCGHCRLETQKK